MKPLLLGIAPGLLLGLLASAVIGCDDSTDETTEPLLEADGLLTITVVDGDEADFTDYPAEPMYTQGVDGDVLVASADADPREVPISWSYSTADASTDFMRVTVQLEDDFVDQVTQVELRIDVSSDGVDDVCWPMKRSDLIVGLFYLELQPGCADHSSSDGMCEIPSGSREDLLTFSLYDDISTDCHGWSTAEQE